MKRLPDLHVAICQEMGQQSIEMPLDNLIWRLILKWSSLQTRAALLGTRISLVWECVAGWGQRMQVLRLLGGRASGFWMFGAKTTCIHAVLNWHVFEGKVFMQHIYQSVDLSQLLYIPRYSYTVFVTHLRTFLIRERDWESERERKGKKRVKNVEGKGSCAGLLCVLFVQQGRKNVIFHFLSEDF